MDLGPRSTESNLRSLSNTSDVPRVTSKGQVTIPVALRYALDLGPGDSVVFAIEDGRGVFRKATALDDLARSLAVQPRTGRPRARTPPGGGRRRVRARGRASHPPWCAPAPARRGAARHRDRARAPWSTVAGRGRTLRDVLAHRGVRVDHPTACGTRSTSSTRGDRCVRTVAAGAGRPGKGWPAGTGVPTGRWRPTRSSRTRGCGLSPVRIAYVKYKHIYAITATTGTRTT